MDCNFSIPEDGILFAPKDDEYIQMLAKADKVPYQVVDYNELLQNPKPKLLLFVNQRIWITSLKDQKHSIVMNLNHHSLKLPVFYMNIWIQEYLKRQD